MSSPVDERLVADAARRLGAGGLPYSDRQLWYAACVLLERPQVTQGVAQIAAGATLFAIGLVVGILATVFVAILVPVGMVIVGMGLQSRRMERNRPSTRPLAVSYDGFVRDTLAPIRERGTPALPGLLPADGVPGSRPPLRPLPDGTALLVCDHGETAALLDALAPAEAPTWRAVAESEATPHLAGTRLHAVHDADPQGCGLALRLAAAGATEVVDLGLRPSQLTGRHIQVIEGAPLVVPPGLSGLLVPDEVVWLAEGRRTELAILAPADIVAGLRAALAAPPAPPPGAAPRAVALGGASIVLPAPEVAVDSEARARAAAADDAEPVEPSRPSAAS